MWRLGPGKVSNVSCSPSRRQPTCDGPSSLLLKPHQTRTPILGHTGHKESVFCHSQGCTSSQAQPRWADRMGCSSRMGRPSTSRRQDWPMASQLRPKDANASSLCRAAAMVNGVPLATSNHKERRSRHCKAESETQGCAETPIFPLELTLAHSRKLMSEKLICAEL